MPVLTFLSDYGLLDEFVGVCHGVIARIAPEVRVIDVTHGVQRHDVRTGALMLRGALPYMPAGVHLAVVDPEVGGGRRPGAARAAPGGRTPGGPRGGGPPRGLPRKGPGVARPRALGGRRRRHRRGALAAPAGAGLCDVPR